MSSSALPFRQPPVPEREQLDLFRALPGDMAPRDSQDLMAFPFFSLAKSRRVAPIDFRASGITLRGLSTPGSCDSMVASYLIDASRSSHGLDSLALALLSSSAVAVLPPPVARAFAAAGVPLTSVGIVVACLDACDAYVKQRKVAGEEIGEPLDERRREVATEQDVEPWVIGQAVMSLNGTLEYFVRNVFNYPTLAECYKVAALDAALAGDLAAIEHADSVVNAAIEIMRERGAVIVDPADIPTAKQLGDWLAMRDVLLYEFKDGLNKYLAWLGPASPVHSLKDVIAFNNAHCKAIVDATLPRVTASTRNVEENDDLPF